MSAPDRVYELVEKFDRDKPGSETEVRIQFVDPLFKALGWHKQLPDLTGAALRIVNARIAATDREIDELVYELYGLSEDEVKIVEGR